mgnify:CR=1 FL=1
MAAPNTTFSQILSTTIEAYTTNGKFADNIYDGLRTAQVLIDMGGKKREDGGESIVVQLEYAENMTAQWMGPYGTLDTSPQDILTAAQFNWRQIAGTVILTDLEQVQNKGKAKMADLASLKLRNLMKSLRSRLNEAIFNAGTDPVAPVGFQAVFSTTGTYGGISRSANAWWRANVEATAEQLGLVRMRNMWNTCSHNLEAPKFIVTTQTLYERLEAMASGIEEIQHPQNQGSADLGFEHLRFKGAPIFWDGDCNSGAMYYVNPEYVKLHCDKDWEFRVLPTDRPGNQNLEIHKVAWFGAIAASNCRMLGVLTGKTP